MTNRGHAPPNTEKINLNSLEDLAGATTLQGAALECAATALTDVRFDRPFRIACVTCPEYLWHVERSAGAFLFTDDLTVAGFAAPMARALDSWLQDGGDLACLKRASRETGVADLPDLSPAARAVHQRFDALLADWDSPSWHQPHTSCGWLRRWTFDILVEHWSDVFAIARGLQVQGRLTYAETRKFTSL